MKRKKKAIKNKEGKPLFLRILPRIKKAAIMWLLYTAIHLGVFAAYIAINIHAGPVYAEEKPGVFGFDNFTATCREQKVTVKWNVRLTYSSDPLAGVFNPDSYKLYRGDITGGVSPLVVNYTELKSYTIDMSTKEESIAEEFIDTTVVPGRRYCYYLKANDLRTAMTEVMVPASGYVPGTGTIGQEKATAFEKVLAGPLEGLYDALQLAGFKSYEELLFNSGSSGTEPYLIPFTKEEWDKLTNWYMAIAAGSFGLVFIGILLMPYKLAKSALNPLEQVRLMEELWRRLLVIGLLLAAPIFIKIMFLLNTGLTNVIYAISTGFGSAVILDNNFFNSITTGNALLTSIVKLGYMLLLVYLNFLFEMRKFILATFYAATAIMAYLWSMNNNSPVAGIWIGEVISNAFMGSSYALVFSIWNSLLAGQTWWVILFGMVILSPVAEILRNCFQGFTKFLGVNEQKSAATAAAGFGGLMGVLSFGKAAMGGSSPGARLYSGTGGLMSEGKSFTPSSQVASEPSAMTVPSFSRSAPALAMAAGMGSMGGYGGHGGYGGGGTMYDGKRYAQTQNGIFAPPDNISAGGEGGAAAGSSGVLQNTPGGVSARPKYSTMAGAYKMAGAFGKVGRIAGKAVFAAAASPLASVSPSMAREVADMGSRVAEGVARMTGAATYIAGDMAKRVKGGQSASDALMDMSGGALNKTTAFAGITSNVVRSAAKERPVNINSMDQFRWN